MRSRAGSRIRSAAKTSSRSGRSAAAAADDSCEQHEHAAEAGAVATRSTATGDLRVKRIVGVVGIWVPAEALAEQGIRVLFAPARRARDAASARLVLAARCGDVLKRSVIGIRQVAHRIGREQLVIEAVAVRDFLRHDLAGLASVAG